MHSNANATAHLGAVALAMVYNPTMRPQSAALLKMPLYCTGETNTVELATEEGPFATVALARDYSVDVTVVGLKPQGVMYSGACSSNSHVLLTQMLRQLIKSSADCNKLCLSTV